MWHAGVRENGVSLASDYATTKTRGKVVGKGHGKSTSIMAELWLPKVTHVLIPQNLRIC